MNVRNVLSRATNKTWSDESSKTSGLLNLAWWMQIAWLGMTVIQHMSSHLLLWPSATCCSSREGCGDARLHTAQTLTWHKFRNEPEMNQRVQLWATGNKIHKGNPAISNQLLIINRASFSPFPQVPDTSPTKSASFFPDTWYRKTYEETTRSSTRPAPEGAGSMPSSTGTPSPGSGISSPGSFSGSPGTISPGIGTESPGSLGGSPGFGTGSPASGSGSSPGSERVIWCENCNARLTELKRQALKLLIPGPYSSKVKTELSGLSHPLCSVQLCLCVNPGTQSLCHRLCQAWAGSAYDQHYFEK